MAKLSDVANLAGVSVATVSRVINESDGVSPELRARVEEALAELNYALDVSARTLRTRRSYTIGFLITDVGYLDNPFLMDVARGVELTASAKDYSVILRTITDDGEEEAEAINLVRRNQVDGLVIAGILEGSRIPSRLSEMNFPYVLVSRRLSRFQTNYVGVDDFDGMIQLVDYLTDIGHRRIGFISGEPRSSVTKARLRGYKVGLSKQALPFDENLVVEAGYDPKSSYRATDILLSRSPLMTAIVTTTDRMAFGAWRCLSDRGFHVPRDMSLAGFDDIDCASLTQVGLTTVRRPKMKVGEIATELLIEGIVQDSSSHPVERILPVSLVIRDTCAPPKTSQETLDTH